MNVVIKNANGLELIHKSRINQLLTVTVESHTFVQCAERLISIS